MNNTAPPEVPGLLQAQLIIRLVNGEGKMMTIPENFDLAAVGQTSRNCGYFCNGALFIPYERILHMEVLVPELPGEVKRPTVGGSGHG